MKIILALAAMLGTFSAQAADLTCDFATPVGIVSALLADDGNGFDTIKLTLNGDELESGTCRAENSFRRSAIRCGAVINRDSRIEFYRSYFPRREPQVKYSMIVWTNLSSNNPRSVTVDGKCGE